MRENAFGEPTAQHFERRDGCFVIENEFAVVYERSATGTGEIQRVEIVEAPVPRRLERSPHRPSIEATITVGIPRQLVPRLDQLTVVPRRSKTRGLEQIDVVHPHLWIRFPRKRVDP